MRQQMLECALRTIERAGQAQKARIVVQRQDQAMKLEQHLLSHYLSPAVEATTRPPRPRARTRRR